MARLTRWDGAEYLEDEDAIAELLTLAMKRGDKGHILNCLDCAIRARNINRLAEETGISREKIFEMFSVAKAPKAAVVKVAKAFIAEPAIQSAR